MVVKKVFIEGLLVIEPKVFEDDRGYFFESYNKRELLDYGINEEFVQDNQSKSNKGVLRGLHYQKAPYEQGKLVRVFSGAVLDVAVDIRPDSPTYGQHFKIELSGDNKKMLWIPPGFAHGFLTLENNTVFFYKCTGFYMPEAEETILWNDPYLAINWGMKNPTVSYKDKNAGPFKQK